MGMNSVFNEQILADKLSKINSTQQCVETLSHWCIFHRSKAELVVGTWDKQFHNSEKGQRVPLLYLANDILQNSKRKGNEFVTEFWKILPKALKDALDKGDDREKRTASRLVDIWEERKVFGSLAENLKNVILGADAPPPLEFNKKRSRTGSVRIVKKDSRSIRTKLTIGGPAEKIVSAFHTVLSEHPNEDAEMSKCKSSVHRVRKMEKDVDIACTVVKDPKRKTLAKELVEEESIMKRCIENLKLVEASRAALVSQLKEALHEQESELENVRTQIQVAQAQVEEASDMRKRLQNENISYKPSTSTTSVTDTKSEAAAKKSAAAIAAEVADKLAASSSSQFIMSSVLKTFAAEEAKNAGLASEPMSKPGNSVHMPDQNAFMSAPQLFATPNHSYPSALLHQPTVQNPSAASQVQYNMMGNSSSQQYLQPSGGIISPYGYGSIPHLPPGPPPPPPMVSPMMQTLQIPQQQHPAPITQHQPITMMQQAPAAPSFQPIQPPGGNVYYGNYVHSK